MISSTNHMEAYTHIKQCGVSILGPSMATAFTRRNEIKSCAVRVLYPLILGDPNIVTVGKKSPPNTEKSTYVMQG